MLNLQPTLTGLSINLRPINVNDFDALHLAASDPKTWEQHPDSQRYQRDVFKQRYFDGAISSGGALVILDSQTNQVIGSSRYYDIDEMNKELAIGFTFLSPSYWGGGANTELKKLMLDHAFEWANSVWLHIGETNYRSRKATEKLGAVLMKQEHRISNDLDYVQLYYKLTRSVWLARQT